MRQQVTGVLPLRQGSEVSKSGGTLPAVRAAGRSTAIGQVAGT